jgi:hypothetical protein
MYVRISIHCEKDGCTYLFLFRTLKFAVCCDVICFGRALQCVRASCAQGAAINLETFSVQISSNDPCTSNTCPKRDPYLSLFDNQIEKQTRKRETRHDINISQLSSVHCIIICCPTSSCSSQANTRSYTFLFTVGSAGNPTLQCTNERTSTAQL